MSVIIKEKILWADMEDSSDEELPKSTIKNNIIIDDFNSIMSLSTIQNSNKLYNYVTARFKNFSCSGLNNISKNLSNIQNIKIEFFYTRRNLRINKIYKNISKEQFTETFNVVTTEYKKTQDTNILIKKLYQYCFVDEDKLYLPFFCVDEKYFDTIRSFDSNKSYKVMFYPLSI